MQLKVHRSYRLVVSLADTDLIGKKFEEGNKQLDVRENFYKDREVTKEEAIRLLIIQSKEDATFNIVGKESIQTALEAGIIDQDSIATVSGIPYSLVLL